MCYKMTVCRNFVLLCDFLFSGACRIHRHAYLDRNLSRPMEILLQDSLQDVELGSSKAYPQATLRQTFIQYMISFYYIFSSCVQNVLSLGMSLAECFYFFSYSLATAAAAAAFNA